MIKKIFGTFGTRLLNALVGFITLWFGTNFLGREAWGIGATVLVDVSLLLIAVELLSGSGLIYYTPRKSFVSLFKISYAWTFIMIAFFALVFFVLHIFSPAILNAFIPDGYAVHILLMVLLYSLHNFNMNVLLGKERVGTQNVLFIIQFMTQLISMITYIFVFDIRDANAFVYSLITGYVVVNICGFICIIPYFSDNQHERLIPTAKEMFSFGSMIQLSTLVTMINRRISYFVIKRFFGMSEVGVYTSGTQVSEATKLIGNSIALVQFSSISNMDDKKKAADLTVTFLKLAVILTALCMIAICLIPKSIYAWIFTPEFAETKDVLVSLTPGMVFMAANMIFSHYFSGVNLPKHNLYGSLVGLLVTIPSIFILIPRYGIIGAGISVSITYLATIIYQWFVFKKETKVKTIQLLPTLNDFKTLIRSLKQLTINN